MKSTVLAVALGAVGDEEYVLNESNAVVEVCGPSSAFPAGFWVSILILPEGKRERDSVSMILIILR